jgi:hypothetical protein
MRGVGRGSKFFVLDRTIWDNAWAVRTTNRMNLLTALLVLLAGTGSDHRLTKWSAKACEFYAGMGKPRAKLAIEELINAGVISRTASSTALFPQYQFPEPRNEDEPIFLPMQLVTGFGDETPMLRRVRECGDPLLLRMLIDLYGHIQTDLTHGVPLSVLREFDNTSDSCQKVVEVGVHAAWALSLGNTLQATGKWRTRHMSRGNEQQFWPRVHMLQTIGAIWFEPWVFGSDSDDAEPLFPVLAAARDDGGGPPLAFLAGSTARLLVADRPYLLSRYTDKILVVLPVHHSPPALRGICRLRVEADTPGRRTAFGARLSAISRWHAAYERLYADLVVGRTDRPVRAIAVR